MSNSIISSQICSSLLKQDLLPCTMCCQWTSLNKLLKARVLPFSLSCNLLISSHLTSSLVCSALIASFLNGPPQSCISGHAALKVIFPGSAVRILSAFWNHLEMKYPQTFSTGLLSSPSFTPILPGFSTFTSMLIDLTTQKFSLSCQFSSLCYPQHLPIYL